MTLPLSPASLSDEEPTPVAPAPPPVAAAPPPPPPTMTFPAGWLLSNATPPLQYRAMAEVAELPELAAPLATAALAFPPAIALAITQRAEGSWSDTMLTIPRPKSSYFQGVGTIQAVRRLTEYGWGQDTPPIHQARRPLFRLLAEDESPAVLYEFGGRQATDEDLVRRGRAILRDASAAALAQARFDADPRLRGAVRRILNRAVDYLRSPLAQKPFVRVGNQHVLASEAAPPSIYGLAALAHLPSYRIEFHDEMEVLYHHLAQPVPRMDAVQQCGATIVEQPQLVLGDMLGSRHVADTDLPFALHWLELMARLGFLTRNAGWMKLFERLLDHCDASGLWKPGKGVVIPKEANPFAWHMWLLDPEHPDGVADVTFRLGLIARLIGWQVALT
ncbi:MAG: hypothetical protein ACYC3Q_00185 [Gemmatimonadaceae bacterium]